MVTKPATHHKSKRTKRYALRDKKGQLEDVQTYKSAHGRDIKRRNGDTFYDLTIASPPVAPKGTRVSSIRKAVLASRKK
jgi:hypothetical protein